MRHQAREMKIGFLGKINTFLKATLYCTKHTSAVYKQARWKFALYILQVFFILLRGKTCLQASIPGSVTKCQDFSDLPSSKSKISGSLASSHFPFGSSTVSSPASSWPPRCLLMRLGISFKFWFFKHYCSVKMKVHNFKINTG